MDTTGTLFMPPGQSTMAPQVDALFNFILIVAAIFFVVVVAIMVYFVWRYRRRGKEAWNNSTIAACNPCNGK